MINNIDTGEGKVKFSYRIIVVVSDKDPISRMMDSLKANEQLNKYAEKGWKVVEMRQGWSGFFFSTLYILFENVGESN